MCVHYRALLCCNFRGKQLLVAGSAAGNWSLDSVRQLWERCEPRAPVTARRCGVLTSRRWQPRRGVCAYAYLRPPRPPKTEICQWLAEIVGIPGIPPDPKQPATRQEGERRRASKRRGVFCQRYPLWNEHRCNISQDKGPLCLEKRAGFAAAVHGEYLEAAVRHAKRLFALWWM